jgi:hypothetical protein
MMYPYAEFLIEFDRRHGGLTHRNCPENTRAAVIVETRPFFFLPKVIRNTMFFLGPRWNLHVVCGELSHGYVQSSLTGWDVSATRLERVFHLSAADYNAMIMSPAFWRMFPEDKVLVFQSDAILCGPNIEDFMGYDYVGAPCGRFDEQYIANGGLSLRTRRLMLECASRLRPPPGMPEDVFFTTSLRRMGVPMPTYASACRFAVESIYTEHPVGVHGTDKCFHPIETAEKITRAIAY